MSTCARCGHELGVGRFCTNCGHPIGEPVPESEVLPRLDDAPLPTQADDRPTWLLPVVGATLALLLVAALLAWLGRDDDPGTTGGRATGRASSAPERAQERRPVNVAPTARVEAPAAAEATTDLDGTLVGYAASQLVDGTPETCWRVGGDGSGSTITFALRRPTTLSRVGLVNGYAKRVPNGTTLVDWYPLNRRVTSVEWVFDDGTTVAQDLREVRRMQVLRVDPVTTRTVQLRILGVTAPGTGPLGRDYTAISEVLLTGTRA
ncbi:zinc ribbon domain-containing protein [Nocardioides sediminis]|uniref:zinc ribbon domain-containing protein n=1 Tax=Nocardioides sediminis TaxID=433648 RepID=UPI00131F00EE|nr:zinc ribbon domain-containing protein [Nocardioides sediminis]